MELIKVPKVANVCLDRGNKQCMGTLYLLLHHLIFKRSEEEELWIPYPLLHTVERQSTTANGRFPLRIRCHHFLFVTLSFGAEQEAIDVFEVMQKLTCVESVDKLYAFAYQPSPNCTRADGWDMYDPVREFERMGVGSLTDEWRFTQKNANYELCPTYPGQLVVPSKISDVTLEHAAKFRSKGRIPVLSYLHRHTRTTISRSSQPMVGLRQSRSVQDEKLVEAIFGSGFGADDRLTTHQRNLIIDARPTANAMANVAMGAGSESTENYRNCRKLFLGIDNIHVMRDSLNRIVDAISSSDSGGIVNKLQLSRSNWLRHLQLVLDGVGNIVRTVHYDRAHVLVHCSDGWDRTAQLTALSALCLDPYYRTVDGFAVLVEKEWCSFGHKFTDRCGHLTHERDFQVAAGAQSSAAEATFSSIQTRLHQQSSHVRETSPVFHQFLDCCYQLWTQAPWRFEFNERYLIALHYHAYACQFGTFLCNTERDRRQTVYPATYSVWTHLKPRRAEFLNDIYDATRDQSTDEGVIVPDTRYLKYWAGLFARRDEEVNGAITEEQPAESNVQRSTATATVSAAKSAAAAISGVMSSLPAVASAFGGSLMIAAMPSDASGTADDASPSERPLVAVERGGPLDTRVSTSRRQSVQSDRLVDEVGQRVNGLSVSETSSPAGGYPGSDPGLPYARDPFAADTLVHAKSTRSSPSSANHSRHTSRHTSIASKASIRSPHEVSSTVSDPLGGPAVLATSSAWNDETDGDPLGVTRNVSRR